jgi:hypothetical protein
MKYSAFIFSVLIFLSCGEDKSGVDLGQESISQDSVHIVKKGVIANFDSTRYYNSEIISFPLYGNPSADAVVDSLFYLRHFGNQGAFYTYGKDSQMVMIHKQDYFNYYWYEKRHQALVFADLRNGRYQVLHHTDTEERWLLASDLDSIFEEKSWDELIDTLDIDSLCIKPANRKLQGYLDTSFTEKTLDIKQNKDEYFQALRSCGSFIQVVKHEVHDYEYTDQPWPHYYLPVLKTEPDTAWINVLENGVATIEFRQVGASDMNSMFGVGMLRGGDLYTGNASIENPLHIDSIVAYDNPNGNSVGSIPVNDQEVLFSKARYYENGKKLIRWNSGLDITQGLTSWNYIKVYEKKKNFLRLFKSKYENRPFWINRKDLRDEIQYYSYDQYYLHFLSGNEGWTKGYSWCGGHDFLYAEPDVRSEKIYEFPAAGNIFLTGVRDGDWVEVKVKELEHIFGEMYYSGDDHRWHTWKGWIRLSDEDGHGNLEEIILGC